MLMHSWCISDYKCLIVKLFDERQTLWAIYSFKQCKSLSTTPFFPHTHKCIQFRHLALLAEKKVYNLARLVRSLYTNVSTCVLGHVNRQGPETYIVSVCNVKIDGQRRCVANKRNFAAIYLKLPRHSRSGHIASEINSEEKLRP
jgi:hypothetical protein